MTFLFFSINGFEKLTYPHLEEVKY